MADDKMIYKAINKVMADVKPVSKKETKGLNYAFRGIDDIYNAINPVLAKHGVFNTLDVEEKTIREYKTASGSVWQNTCIKVKYKFFCEDGSFIELSVWGEGSDGGDKGTSKALSQAHKTAICQLLCLPFEAGDVKEVQEAVAHDITKEQHKELSMAETVKAFPPEVKDLLKAAGYTTLQTAFKAYQGVAGDMDALKQLCNEKARKK
jgi:hypothetical protein